MSLLKKNCENSILMKFESGREKTIAFVDTERSSLDGKIGLNAMEHLDLRGLQERLQRLQRQRLQRCFMSNFDNL